MCVFNHLRIAAIVGCDVLHRRTGHTVAGVCRRDDSDSRPRAPERAGAQVMISVIVRINQVSDRLAANCPDLPDDVVAGARAASRVNNYKPTALLEYHSVSLERRLSACQ